MAFYVRGCQKKMFHGAKVIHRPTWQGPHIITSGLLSIKWTFVQTLYSFTPWNIFRLAGLLP